MDEQLAKRKKPEFKELLRTYPQLNNYELSCTMVPCPAVDKKDDVKKVFQRYCPVFFLIENLHYYKNWRAPTCIWQVDYVHSKGNQSGDEPNLQTKVETLMHKYPENCTPIGHLLEETEKITVFYSVFCDCAPKVFDNMNTKSSSSLDEIQRLTQGLHLDGEVNKCILISGYC